MSTGRIRQTQKEVYGKESFNKGLQGYTSRREEKCEP